MQGKTLARKEACGIRVPKDLHKILRLSIWQLVSSGLEKKEDQDGKIKWAQQDNKHKREEIDNWKHFSWAQQDRAGKLPVTSFVTKKVPKEAYKMPERRPEISVGESKSIVNSGLDGYLSGKLTSSYIEPLMAIDDMSWSRVMDRYLPACFHDAGTNGISEHVTPLFVRFLFEYLTVQTSSIQISLSCFWKTFWGCTELQIQWMGTIVRGMSKVFRIECSSSGIGHWSCHTLISVIPTRWGRCNPIRPCGSILISSRVYRALNRLDSL